MRLTEIDKIVFEEKKAKQLQPLPGKRPGAPANNNKRSVNDTKQSIRPYEEEESYENPVNLRKMPGLVDDYIDIRSDYFPNYLHVNNSIGPSKGFVNIDNIELDDSDI